MQRTRQLPWQAITTLGVLACTAAPAAAKLTFSTVALSGQPGMSYGFSAPFINDAGQLAFTVVDSNTGRSVFAGPPGALKVIARSGSPAPGFPSGFQYQGNFSYVVINNTGRVAFWNEVKESSTGHHSHGVFSGPLSAPTLVAWSGGPAPGTPPESNLSLSGLNRIDLNDAGDLAFQASLYRPGPTPAYTSAIFAGPPTALGIVARNGDQATGLPVGVPYARVSYLGSNDAGQVVFSSELDSGMVIFAGRPGSVAPVARTGSPAPGMPPGVSYGSILSYVLNNHGQVALSTWLVGNGVPEGADAALYVGPIASPSPVARTGDPAPGTPPGVSYESFWRSTLSDAGQVKFLAALHGPGVTRANDTAVYVGSPDAPVLVAREGSPAPGTPPGVNFGRFGTDPGFALGELNDRGQLAFDATLLGPGEVQYGSGLFLYDPALGTTLVARTGALFDVGGGNLRRIEDISYDYGGGVLGDDGRLAFSLLFTDGSSGIFVATVPEPGPGLVLLGAAEVILLGRRGGSESIAC